ncbi:MAG: twin-arginine translocation signal domain-containing protein, partial [Gemmatimonadetes bacterium]|nr:twin-arginine translocation signal domain-containing protein [Gemmatimonadota bacterium]NIS33828.1 twin-arginine translocation signal domain-containing protein [Actinomycetota bacterium]NIW30497.1 twin-arginine translocation signal domain-containing protein [Actinomycetota bacterium]
MAPTNEDWRRREFVKYASAAGAAAATGGLS